MTEHAGFWRRAVAIFIDAFVVAIVLQLVAIVVFPMSEGRVQMISSGLRLQACHGLQALPSGFSPTPPPNTNFATNCSVSFFGLPTANVTIVGTRTQNGNLTKTVSTEFMVDKKGLPILGLPLDILIWPLTLLLRFWTDRRDGSPGRRFCKIRLLRCDTRVPPSYATLARRYFIFALPMLPWWLSASYRTVFPSFEPTNIALFAGTIAINCIASLWAVIAIIRRKDAFYDRAAGTEIDKVMPILSNNDRDQELQPQTTT